MNPQNPFWAGVLKKETELEATGKSSFHITSVDELARAPTCEVDRRNAAKCIFQKTHRLATDAEIEAYRAGQREREAICAAMTDRNEKKRSLSLPAGLIEQLLGENHGDFIVATTTEEPKKGAIHEFPTTTDRAS